MLKRRIAERRWDDPVRVVPPPTETVKKTLELDDSKSKQAREAAASNIDVFLTGWLWSFVCMQEGGGGVECFAVMGTGVCVSAQKDGVCIANECKQNAITHDQNITGKT